MSVSTVPALAPEGLDLIFRLGVCTTDQLHTLLPRRVSVQRVRGLVRCMQTGFRSGGTAPLIETSRRRFQHFEAASGARWKAVHTLTEHGLRFVAERRDLHPRVAGSLYARAYREATVDHALLRNDFFARFADALETSTDEDHEGVWFDTMCGETGLDSILLETPEGQRPRYLNPDGMVELHRERDPGFYVSFYVESDTGSEDMRWQISRKAEQYAEHLAKLLEAGKPLPKVLFVSPTVTRSRWVRQVFFAAGQDPANRLCVERNRFKDKGAKLPPLFVFTNLEWQRDHGTLGPSYWALSGRHPDLLF